MSRPTIIKIKLWTINKYLRYTGFRLFVEQTNQHDSYTHIGIMWWGFRSF